MTPDGKTKLTIDVPAKLKQDFKVDCVLRGTTMTDELTAFMERRLAQSKKKKGSE